MRDYTEKEIIAGCIRNERSFQELLYRQHFAVMMGICMRYTKDRDVAMQIVNNGFLKVFKKIDTFSFKGSFEGWIKRIIYHSVSDYFRSSSNKLHFLMLEDRDKPISGEALEQLYFEDIMNMVEMLPPATKQVFVLYAIEGYKHHEIATKLGISEGTSKWHLSAARKTLRQLIEQHKLKSNAS
ncbi:MAG: RNA polymerase sigma factor [Bacteroidota bacterium]